MKAEISNKQPFPWVLSFPVVAQNVRDRCKELENVIENKIRGDGIRDNLQRWICRLQYQDGRNRHEEAIGQFMNALPQYIKEQINSNPHYTFADLERKFREFGVPVFLKAHLFDQTEHDHPHQCRFNGSPCEFEVQFLFTNSDMQHEKFLREEFQDTESDGQILIERNISNLKKAGIAEPLV